MACKFKQDGNPRWCTTIQGECQFLTADDGPKCPIYNAFPEGWTHGPPPEPLPYDAKVEYLESTGTQLINTGIYPSSGLIIYTRCSPIDSYVFGTYQGKVFIHVNRSSANSLTVSAWSSSATLTDISIDPDIPSVFEIDTSNGNKKISIDGTIVHTWSTTTSIIGNYPIGLFGRIYSSHNYGMSKVYAFSIRDTSTNQLLVDLIPVKKDGVGYMYDNISGNLLGNSGTGEFVLGPDV